MHSRWGTPYVAIVLNASLACVYVLARSFDQLAEAFVLGCGRSLHLPLPQSQCFGGPAQKCRDRIGRRVTQCCQLYSFSLQLQ